MAMYLDKPSTITTAGDWFNDSDALHSLWLYRSKKSGGFTKFHLSGMLRGFIKFPLFFSLSPFGSPRLYSSTIPAV